ncbi:ABC transporter ATP-binding protein [Acinetobacter puyangensis]|uniref:ABC transporter ATP-binding protein n=1 Tax=Acinetobacter puyangensis TaxID=1096779 RepID=UPI003A4E0F05
MLNQQKNHQETKTDVWSIMLPIKPQIHLAIVLSVISCIASMVLLLSLSRLIHGLLTITDYNYWFDLILIFVFASLAFILRLQAFNQSHFASFRLETILRERLTQALARAPLGFLSTLGSGAIAKILKDDVRNLHVFVADSTPLYARAYFLPILTFVVLCWIDWRMALAAFAVLAVGMIILSIAMRNSTTLHQQYNLAREDISNNTIEFVQAMPVVRVFGGDDYSFQSYRNALHRFNQIVVNWYQQSGWSARTSLLVLNPLPTLVVLIWTGLYFWNQHLLTFSQWQATLLIGTGMAEALMPYMSLYHMIEKAKISIERIDQLEQAPQLPVTEFPQQPQHFAIEFKNIFFKYTDRTDWALYDVSFCIPQNHFTAVVGASGAGKSTLAKLIPRFWDVDQGEICIGDVNIKEMLPEDLMAKISMVFQDNFLFSGTIAENICLGLDKVDEAVMIEAAKLAQIHDFIMSLEKGYQTLLGERGASLSCGQIQRLTIARAILQNRPIILFDEATAYADAENEALLMQAIQQLVKNKTVLMIAHRLSTIQHADNIMVFDQGKLMESGSHQQLIEQQGIYAGLWHTSQTARQWKINTISQPEQEENQS